MTDLASIVDEIEFAWVYAGIPPSETAAKLLEGFHAKGAAAECRTTGPNFLPHSESLSSTSTSDDIQTEN